MKPEKSDRAGVFYHAQEIIQKDETIPLEEKEGILKLIQALIEAAEASSYPKLKDNHIKTFTQEVVSKHALMTLVKQQADELDALKRLGINLTSSLDLQTVLDAVVSEAMRLVKHSYAAHIFLYVNNTLEFGAALNKDGLRNKPINMPRPNGLTYSVVGTGQQIQIEDMATHEFYKDVKDAWIGSIIGIPLRYNNVIVGVMNLSRSVVGKFTDAELRLLGLLADQAAVAISNASLHKQVTELANTDSVTGLPNRRALDERLQDEVRYAKRTNINFAVVMMDLDGFKAVNDTYGHAVGDDVLRQVFNYLAQSMRSSDFLARYGGDELTLIMRDADQNSAEFVTQKIIDLISNYRIDLPSVTKPLKLGITAGISLYPLHSRNAGDLLRAADAALYQAKKHNRGSYMVAKGVTGPLGAVTVQVPRFEE